MHSDFLFFYIGLVEIGRGLKHLLGLKQLSRDKFVSFWNIVNLFNSLKQLHLDFVFQAKFEGGVKRKRNYEISYKTFLFKLFITIFFFLNPNPCLSKVELNLIWNFIYVKWFCLSLYIYIYIILDTNFYLSN